MVISWWICNLIPNCPIWLRTAYPASTDTPGTSSYYSVGAKLVAQSVPNVLLTDTYNAAVSYTTAVSNGWMGDGTHRNATGRAALEVMVSAILLGQYRGPTSNMG